MHYFLHNFSERTLYPLSLAALASSPKGTPYGTARNFIATTKSRPLGEGGLPRSGKTEGGKTRTQFANLNCIFFAFYGDFQQFCGNVKNFADFA